MSPDIERQIERVLVLAGKPVMRRPIAAATVFDALPRACEIDRATCDRVRTYLQRYMKTWNATQLEVQAAATAGDSTAVQPNSHGERVDSAWRTTVQGYWQPSDYLIVNAGGIAYDGEATPTGSFVSMGFDWAQLDLGYRDHWLSPFRDSSSTISTEATTMPSVTLSNYAPISPLGFSYEIFGAEMANQNGISSATGDTSGKPRIAGLQLMMEPVIGYALGINRITQYGGGARGGRGFSDFKDALTSSANRGDSAAQASSDTNKIAAITANLLFPGAVPFNVYFEYSGEDNTFEGPYRLGDTNLSAGIDFPLLWNNFDATVEVSEWQTFWYVHHLYQEGLTNRGVVIGHWFGDNRTFDDSIGGHSAMLRGGWRLPSGDYARVTYRTMALDKRWAFTNPQRDYSTLQMLELGYSTQWRGFPIEAKLVVGEDVFGESFARIAASFDFARTGSRASAAGFLEGSRSGTEVFVDVGAQVSRAREYLLLQFNQRETTSFETSYHVGVGARRPVSRRNDLGVRLELDRVNAQNLISVRALDYRFRLNDKLAVGAFLGAGRYDIGLPAYGYYLGGGIQYRNLLPGWDIGLEYHHYDKLTRDKGLPGDPESNPGLPRRVIDIDGYGLYVSKRW